MIGKFLKAVEKICAAHDSSVQFPDDGTMMITGTIAETGYAVIFGYVRKSALPQSTVNKVTVIATTGEEKKETGWYLVTHWSRWRVKRFIAKIAKRVMIERITEAIA